MLSAVLKINADFFPDACYTAFVLGELCSETKQAEQAVALYSSAIELHPGAQTAVRDRAKNSVFSDKLWRRSDIWE